MRPFSFGFAPGSVLAASTPRGYRRLQRSTVIGGASAFDEAAAAVRRWAVQRRSGIAVRTPEGRDAPEVFADQEGVVAVPLLVAGAARLEIAAPFRVTRVLDGADEAGFAYGTLHGHPEHGEESFVVRREGRETVFELRALSRPAFPYALAPLAGRALQARFTARYLRALLPPLRGFVS